MPGPWGEVVFSWASKGSLYNLQLLNVGAVQPSNENFMKKDERRSLISLEFWCLCFPIFLAMLVSLSCISPHHHFKPVAMAQMNRKWRVSQLSPTWRLADRFGFGLHVHWVIELPRDVAWTVGAIIAHSKCTCFPQSSKSPEAWLIDWWTHWFTGWWLCPLMFVHVCCELLCLPLELLFFSASVCEVSFSKLHGTTDFELNMDSQWSKDGDVVDN